VQVLVVWVILCLPCDAWMCISSSSLPTLLSPSQLLHQLLTVLLLIEICWYSGGTARSHLVELLACFFTTLCVTRGYVYFCSSADVAFGDHAANTVRRMVEVSRGYNDAPAVERTRD